MHRVSAAIAASVIAISCLLTLLLAKGIQHPAASAPEGATVDDAVVVFSAASNRAVMEEVASTYESRFGIQIHLQYGPSQHLLSAIEVSRTGDIFLPADDSYVRLAESKNLVFRSLPVARMHAVVAVQRGNPKRISTLDDLLRDDVRLVQASPDSAAIGNLTRRVLLAQELWKPLDEATVAYRLTVTDVANDLLVGSADAGIVYDAVLHSYPELHAVSIPELDSAASILELALLNDGGHRPQTLHFANFVTSLDGGLSLYRRHGFDTSVALSTERK